ncbi:hypothetical protein LX69_02749 [Breznakibacter xylanolyticus]|uniref:Transmembrane protein n=1 Tax=Breznakibacter xylanolyticus TaxID=990 RepID=A0A2W7MXQ6_9BACT|nr:hypothetical protein [Breznakibacter xylanolyticus]PZX12945.1 hypothetical protein LX69_02749 [Breznakibacter xylanolyticus]
MDDSAVGWLRFVGMVDAVSLLCIYLHDDGQGRNFDAFFTNFVNEVVSFVVVLSRIGVCFDGWIFNVDSRIEFKVFKYMALF